MLRHLWKFVRMRVCTRLAIRLALLAGIAVPGLVPVLRATTLEQLTLDDMTQKSTAIVRARVTGSHSAYRGNGRGADIYTYYQIQVLETWKSAGPVPTEVAVPGGAANGIRQSVAGAPVLKPGQEYVLFLWTSRSGLTQVIGLSQGVFNLSVAPSGGTSGGPVAQRPPASELMLNSAGMPVEDRAVSYQLQDLRQRVAQTLGAAK
jgi:hypothetical protein